MSNYLFYDNLWKLDNGLLDLALLAETIDTYIDHTEELWQENVLIALPENHLLAERSSLDLKHLIDYPIIIGENNNISAADRVLIEAFRAADIKNRIFTTVAFTETRLMMVAAGLGITALPAFSSALTTTPGIVVRPLSPPLKMTTVAVWPASGLTPAAQRFLSIARSFKEAETGDAVIIPS